MYIPEAFWATACFEAEAYATLSKPDKRENYDEYLNLKKKAAKYITNYQYIDNIINNFEKENSKYINMFEKEEDDEKYVWLSNLLNYLLDKKKNRW